MTIILLLVITMVVALLVVLFSNSSDKYPQFKSCGVQKFTMRKSLPVSNAEEADPGIKQREHTNPKLKGIPISSDDLKNGPLWEQVTVKRGVVTTRFPNGATYIFHHPPTLKELYAQEVAKRVARAILAGLLIAFLFVYGIMQFTR